MSASGGKKAIIAALLANMGIAIAKFAGFLITGASSLLAESIHSVADSGNQALLLLGVRKALKPADEMHQFGFGRERYFWSFIVAIVLFLLGGAFSLYEGISKLQHPHELESPVVAIGILVVAMALEGWSFRTAIHEARPHKGSASWAQFIRRTKSPELPVVILEDFGALVGLIIAFLAIGASAITGEAVYDGVGTVLIGLLLLTIACVLAFEMKSLLIGESASTDDDATIRTAINGSAPVRNLIYLRTQHLGPEELLVTAKIEFDASLTMTQLAAAIDEVEVNVRTALPIAKQLYIEPDITRAVASDG